VTTTRPDDASATGEGPALVVRGPGDVGIERRSWVVPTGLEVRVTPRHVGLCGTDLEIVGGAMDPDYVRYPLVLGHEWSGTVAAVGDQVTKVAPGDAVVVEGIVPCSVCEACRRGQTNLCAIYDELGFMRDGAAGPSVTTREHLVHRLAASVPLESGALVEPAAVVLRGLSVMDLQPGVRIVVIGAGTIGLLAAHLARLWSPASVTVTGRRPVQAGLAHALGADDYSIDRPEPRSFDVAIEAAGNIGAVGVAFDAARRGGQVLLLGICGHGKTIPLSPDDIVNNDLRIRGSFGYTADAWAQVVALLNAGRLDPRPLITHRFPLDQYEAALDALATPTAAPRGKVLIDLSPHG
jgi:2-desacetyl-2-hydroxyethyl bacteriochlorophyllide A dehydrogenase